MNKVNNSNKTETSEKKYSVHTIIYWNIGWLIVILFILLISISASKIEAFKSSELLDWIVNFATLLSIILSISSILFSYFTSQNTSRHFEEMSNVLAEVKQINNNIQTNNKQLFSMVYQMALNVKSIDVKTELNGSMSNQIVSNSIESLGGNQNISNMNLITPNLSTGNEETSSTNENS